MRQRILYFFSWIKRPPKGPLFLVVFSVILTNIILSAILIFQFGAGILNIKEGDFALKTIRAPKSLYFKSEIKTNEARKQAEEKVKKIFRYNPSSFQKQEAKIDEVFLEISKIKEEMISFNEKTKKIEDLFSDSISPALISEIINKDKEELVVFRNSLQNFLLPFHKENEIKDEDLSEWKMKIQKTTEDPILGEMASLLLLPNSFFDEEETTRQKELAVGAVSPIYFYIEKDQIILKKGEIVTNFDIEILQALGLTFLGYSSQKILGTIFLVFLLTLISGLYFYFSSARLPNFKKSLIIFWLFLIVMTVACRLILPLKPIFAYIFPVAAFPILLAIFVNLEFGIFTSLIFSIVFALGAGGSFFELLFIHFIASLFGIFVSLGKFRFHTFLKVPFYIGLANFASAFAFNLLAESFSLKLVSGLLFAGLINGFLSTILVVAGISLLSHLFKMTSFIQLLELENPSHPLLKNLALKAPGTYFHSMTVAYLGEGAARAIGADPLLVRVASLYHDVGKIKNPNFFVENWKKKKSPFSGKLEEGAQKIINHVEEGVKLAKENHLPQEIIDIIKEHHGKTLVKYFFNLADKKNQENFQEKFRYLGPLPQTKESAIVMLADIVEATSHVFEKEKHPSFRKLIEEIFSEKLEEGQLKDAPLTLKEISKIKEVFVKGLEKIYHERIEYPQKS